MLPNLLIPLGFQRLWRSAFVDPPMLGYGSTFEKEIRRIHVFGRLRFCVLIEHFTCL